MPPSSNGRTCSDVFRIADAPTVEVDTIRHRTRPKPLAFRCATGTTPRQWLTLKQIERASQLPRRHDRRASRPMAAGTAPQRLTGRIRRSGNAGTPALARSFKQGTCREPLHPRQPEFALTRSLTTAPRAQAGDRK